MMQLSLWNCSSGKFRIPTGIDYRGPVRGCTKKNAVTCYGKDKPQAMTSLLAVRLHCSDDPFCCVWPCRSRTVRELVAATQARVRDQWANESGCDKCTASAWLSHCIVPTRTCLWQASFLTSMCANVLQTPKIRTTRRTCRHTSACMGPCTHVVSPANRWCKFTIVWCSSCGWSHWSPQRVFGKTELLCSQCMKKGLLEPVI